MHLAPQFNHGSETPLYRQLYNYIRESIGSGTLMTGERLPATRELADRIGLNRTTVSAAYDLLLKDGLITSHVGRGTFVNGPAGDRPVLWESLLTHAAEKLLSAAQSTAPAETISFAAARPSELLFPVDDFRAACAEVVGGPELPGILQLGSPYGYAPLRDYLVDNARREGALRPSDDVLVTSGCQQAIDLLVRVLVRPGNTALVEDPGYPGIVRAFSRAGARIVGVPVGADGIDIPALENAIAAESPKLVALTASFQNPTGATIPLDARRAIVRACARAGVVILENDIYGDLRYEGEPLPTLKALGERGDGVLLRSFSKIAFPGLRVGWVIAPRQLVAALAAAKQWTDLHSDHLSQAVLHTFASSGRLDRHRQRVLDAGRLALHATTEACEIHLPHGSRFTRPRGGMNLWVRLPDYVDTSELRARALAAGVNYLPGDWFAVAEPHRSCLRLSFGSLDPEAIRRGVAILGRMAKEEIRSAAPYGPAPAMV